MGACTSKDPVLKEEAKTNKDIEKMLKDLKDARQKIPEIKLLLLGAGECGKSTIAKQMKIIHLQGYTQKEKEEFKPIIYQNLYDCVKAIIAGAKTLRIELSDDVKDLAARVIAEGYFSGVINKAQAEDVKKLWHDTSFQQAFSRGSEFQLLDSAQYYIENVDRLTSEGYVPVEQDILRTRVKTTGILETEFEVNKVRFRLVDVGGQRSERKKWIHCFQDVVSVIFCVALSEYDMRLAEDQGTNRMHESLRMFKAVCTTQWFNHTAIILFLNKKDIFEEKIQKTPLTVAFPDYKGPQEFQPAAEFIQKQFVAQCENAEKYIYPHITCATDTSNITHVFNSVNDMIIQRVLHSAGFGV